MRADDLRTDCHGVVSELQDGGYSDDMTLAAIAGNVLHLTLITHESRTTTIPKYIIS